MKFFARLGLAPVLVFWGLSITGGMGAPAPAYDDVPVLVCRLAVIEAASPPVPNGTQFSEASMTKFLNDWRAQDPAAVMVDEGFLLPVHGSMVDPAFDSAGGGPLAGAGASIREPGVALTLGAAAQRGGGYQMQATVSLWNLTGEPVRDSMARIRQFRSPLAERPADGYTTFQTCQPGQETSLSWSGALQQAVAITGKMGSGTGMYQSVIILPVALRPSLVAQPGQPATYTGATLRAVEAEVPSAVFWRVVNNVRPDLSRPVDFSSRMLGLYWPDEKWDLFVNTMQQAGGRFKGLPAGTLDARAPTHRVVSSSLVVSWTLAQPLPTTYFGIAMEDPLALSAAVDRGVSRWCESHDQRWTIFARPMGVKTQIVAVRSQFTGGVAKLATAPKATAVTEDAPAVAAAATVPRAIPVTAAPAGGVATPGAASAANSAPATASVSPSSMSLNVPSLLPESGTPAPATAAATAPAAAPSPSRAAAKAARAQSPLDLYAGEWTGTLTGQPKSRAKMYCNWNFDGTELLRDNSVTLDPSQGSPTYSSMVMKYDELAGKFHSQVVSKDPGTKSVAEGAYDAASRTFIWTAVNPLNGMIMVTRAAFPQDGVMEWTQTITDKQGNLISQGGGKNVRQRK